MTKILKLEMKGFKSFANKTEIPLGDKFNVILGPNGSGKSNVLDAICFVLGKSSAKSLRAEKTANLIYNGGKSKNPAKDAEVSITFDNSKKIFPVKEPVLKLSRRIRPSGQSKYLINDEVRTRQQILEVLGAANVDPNGYNIILQGDITQLVEMSTVERRGIIEEIAGISVYENKKEKALRELNRVEEKLNEAEIILAERKGFIRELKKEKTQAEKFKELDTNIKRNRATLLNTQIVTKKTKQSDYDKIISTSKDKIEKLQTTYDELKVKVIKNREEISKINAEVESKGEKEQVELNRDIEKIKVEFALNKQRLETIKQELDKISIRKTELEEGKTELQRKITAVEKNKKDAVRMTGTKESEFAKLELKLTEFKTKHDIGNAQELDGRIEEIDTRAEEIQVEINDLRETQQNLFREKDKYEIILQNIDGKIDKVLSVEQENKSGIQKLKEDKKAFTKTTEELNSVCEEDTSISVQLDTARSKLLSRKEELSRFNIQSAGHREQAAGDRAANAILKSPITGVHGQVSQLGSVSSDYSLALGIAAGNRIRSIVVETDGVASECIRTLREKRLGTATFLPLNRLHAPMIRSDLRAMKGRGVIGLALDLVKYDAKYQKVFQYVFGNTVVVEDLEVARKLGIGGFRMVTKAGDLVETSGAMQGGYRSKVPGLGFAEKEATEKISILESEIADFQSVIDRLDAKQREHETLAAQLRTQKAELEAEIIKAEKTLHIESGDLDADKEEKKKIKTEIKELEVKTDDTTALIQQKNVELAKLKMEKQSFREKINAIRNPRLLAEINTFDQKREELKEDIAELKGELRNANSELNTILLPEMENINKILDQQLGKEKADFDSEKKTLESTIKEQTKELADKEKKQKIFYSQYKGLFEKRSKFEKEISDNENKMNNKMDELRLTENKSNIVSIERARIVGELEGLEEEYKQFKEVALFRNKPEDEIKLEIKQFERMVSELGAVNMKALELYEKAQTEFEALNTKKESLTTEREDILVMINEIDSKKRELFMKTYEVIDKNFQKIFATLSTKGKAYINLEDRKDPFKGGVEIKVKLSTKKFMDIRSLSGGEKTMTALAFLFAVQEHEPASFYVLDEVDAALDKKNSEKLAELVLAYSKRAQYIMISHNDGVITTADSLFGVSMDQAHGVSKVTSLKI